MTDSMRYSHGEPPSSTACSLLDRIKALDSEAWRQFVRLYGPLVYGWCRKSGLQSSDASDLTQEVFRSVAKQIGSFRWDRPDDSFRGWLWTITHNKIRDRIRANSGRPEAVGGSAFHGQILNEPDPNLSSSGVSSRHNLDREERRDFLKRSVELVRDEFEATTWRAFWLVIVENRAAVDVAKELGMSPGAVRQIKYRVLKRLRQELAGLI